MWKQDPDETVVLDYSLVMNSHYEVFVLLFIDWAVFDCAVLRSNTLEHGIINSL